jgi:hypothetical protein
VNANRVIELINELRKFVEAQYDIIYRVEQFLSVPPEPSVSSISLNCGMKNLRNNVGVVVFVLETPHPDPRVEVEFDNGRVGNLLRQMKTDDFWRPIQAQLHQADSQQTAAEYAVLFARAQNTVVWQNNLPDGQVRTLLEASLVVDSAATAQLLGQIPAEAIGDVLKILLPVVIREWSQLASSGLTLDQAARLLGSRVSQTYYEEIRRTVLYPEK